MTRETKIGLLVGLAFIIVIGILLSDHLTAATEPPQAALVQAGDNVRAAVAVPGGASTPIAQVQVPRQVAPQAPLVTREEMMHKPPAVTYVQVGLATNGEPAANSHEAEHAAPQPTNTPASRQPVADSSAVDSNSVPAARPAENGNHSSLEQVASAMHEEIVPADQKPTAQPPRIAATGQKQYQAQPGDTVSRMAARFLGGNTKANRDLIINANSSLKQDPDKVIVGKSYIIPSPASASAARANGAKLPDKIAAADGQQTAVGAIEHFYTVKPGDTLTKIAVEQLGTPGAVSAIVELNKLPDANHIFPKMKLRLPAKPISVAEK